MRILVNSHPGPSSQLKYFREVVTALLVCVVCTLSTRDVGQFLGQCAYFLLVPQWPFGAAVSDKKLFPLICRNCLLKA